MHKKILKKYYFIEKFKKSNIDKQDLNTTIIYRNYKNNYKISEILFIKEYCERKGLEFLISNNIKLSIKLGLNGAYLPSFNKDFSHLSYNLKKNFFLIGSAHNLKEMRIKEMQNVSKIFLSSIFKENNNYLGLNKFNLLSRLSNKEIISLGGISNKNIRLIRLTNSVGFAGISIFQ